jgi:hypothetical protein
VTDVYPDEPGPDKNEILSILWMGVRAITTIHFHVRRFVRYIGFVYGK